MSNKEKISVISAASGAGKTTVVNHLLAQNERFSRVITHTTREKRPGEKNGVDYHFVSKDEFEQMIAQDAFVEWAKVYDNYYGTSKQGITAIVAQGKHALLVIEWQGAKNIKKLYPKAQFILMLPPSMDELKKRISGRGGDAKDIAQRIDLAKHEIRQMLWYDQVIINDDVEQCIKDLKQALDDQKAFSMHRQKERVQNFI
ncbi:MAG TPA: guanylate kinase [Oligoflexia bacterium]|nr:guanylate kinase [Oligoflexia bacterium]HMR25268.1 guanylate kinase [Oligoflexia bacterium]